MYFINDEEANHYGGEDLKTITKTALRKKLSLSIDGRDLFFMNTLLLFEKMDELFIQISSNGKLNQIDKKRFKGLIR